MSERMIIDYWLEKAGQDLESAQGNFLAGRFENAVRDAYFACFHLSSTTLRTTGVSPWVKAFQPEGGKNVAE